jgi:3-methyl-2-oxobutanoate hydroxymethyltransferase
MQGNDEASVKELIKSAQSLQAAGADLLLLECVPDDLAHKITQQSSIPVIGIGAGAQCDGQILVLHDVLGITHGVTPKFAKNFLADANDIPSAIENYVQDVKSLKFPV